MLVDALPDALMVHRDDVIVFVNPAFVKLMDVKRPEDFIGQSIARLLHPSHLEAIKQQIEIDYATGLPSQPREVISAAPSPAHASSATA